MAESDFTDTDINIDPDRQRSILRWVIGLTLLALLLAGITLALRGPVAVGVDDGTAPAGNVREQTNEPTEEEKNEVPRSLRQYAAARGSSFQAEEWTPCSGCAKHSAISDADSRCAGG